MLRQVLQSMVRHPELIIESITYQTARIRPPVPSIGTSDWIVGSVEIVPLETRDQKNPVGLYPGPIWKARDIQFAVITEWIE